MNEPQTTSPIYVLGRQHCGNTMLASLLGRIPDCFAMTEEGNFFEHRSELGQMAPSVARRRLLSLTRKAQSPPIEDETLAASADAAERKLGGLPDDIAGWDSFYEHLMGHLAAHNEASRWIQKATSYIFYVDDLLEVFPGASLVFLIRNPFDLAASKKRRGEFDRTARMLWGWARGLRLALEYRDQYPESFQVVRYEDLVREPMRIVESICDFVDLPFESSYLDVGHVNPSEDPYSMETGKRGIDDSRVGYFRRVLTEDESHAVRLLASDELLEEMYGKLLEEQSPKGIEGYRKAAQLVGLSVWQIAEEHGRKLRSNPIHTLDRIYRRVFA